MPGYDRPEGGWQYNYEGLNTISPPDALEPIQYPYARNIRVNGRHILTRPGYSLFSTTVHITSTCPITMGTEEIAYTYTFTATGGSTPYTWTLLSGSFPTGLSLATSGILSGTPSDSGYFTFTVLVTDSRGSTDTLSCSMFVIRACEGDGNWSGCMSGSFTVPADWSYFSGNVSNSGITSDGRAFMLNVGGMLKTTNTCSVAQDQEVYIVYQGKFSPFAGTRGYTMTGPGCRLQGTSISNFSGYLFEAQMWGGTVHGFCGNENLITLRIQRISVGVVTTLAATSIAGPDLTPEIPMVIRAVQESGQARVTATLGSTEVLNVLDPSPLAAGAMGFGGTLVCSGINPQVFFDYIKGRNL